MSPYSVPPSEIDLSIVADSIHPSLNRAIIQASPAMQRPLDWLCHIMERAGEEDEGDESDGNEREEQQQQEVMLEKCVQGVDQESNYESKALRWQRKWRDMGDCRLVSRINTVTARSRDV
jgi:hypothetical protein